MPAPTYDEPTYTPAEVRWRLQSLANDNRTRATELITRAQALRDEADVLDLAVQLLETSNGSV